MCFRKLRSEIHALTSGLVQLVGAVYYVGALIEAAPDIIGALDRVAAAIEKLKSAGPPQPQRREVKPVIKLRPNQQPFGYALDLNDITDDTNNPITDPAAIAAIVTDVESTDPNVVPVTPDPPTSEDTAEATGNFPGPFTPGTATVTLKSYANQAAKDAGKDPINVTALNFTIAVGDPAHIGSVAVTLGGGVVDEPAS